MLVLAIVLLSATCAGLAGALLLERKARTPSVPSHEEGLVSASIAHAVTIRLVHEQEDFLRHDEGHRHVACEQRALHYLQNAGLPVPADLRARVKKEIAEQLHEMGKAREAKAKTPASGTEGTT